MRFRRQGPDLLQTVGSYLLKGIVSPGVIFVINDALGKSHFDDGRALPDAPPNDLPDRLHAVGQHIQRLDPIHRQADMIPGAIGRADKLARRHDPRAGHMPLIDGPSQRRAHR
jgi:hypothetical protein